MTVKDGIMTFDKDGLAKKWYEYWQKKGGVVWSRENLCHFARVLFLYAPWRWFFLARTYKVIAPWSVTLTALIAYLFVLFPASILPILAVIAVVATILVAIVFLVILAEERGYWIKKNIGEPIAGALTHKAVGTLPVWFFVSALALGFGLRFVFEFILPLLFIGIFIGAFFGLIAIGIMLSAPIDNWLENRRRTSADNEVDYKPNKMLQGLVEFLEIIWEFVKAKKQKICPFIEFA